MYIVSFHEGWYRGYHLHRVSASEFRLIPGGKPVDKVMFISITATSQVHFTEINLYPLSTKIYNYLGMYI